MALLVTACGHLEQRIAKENGPPSAGQNPVTSENLPQSRLPSTDGSVSMSNETHGTYFDWPVDHARMTRGFLPNKRRPHLGLDLAAKRGSSIYAAQSGTVVYRGQDFRGFGKMILVEGADGWATLYAHLDRFMVQQGQRVVIGDLIGSMGRTGRATGVHLHFEIRKDRKPVDPLAWLPAGHELGRQASY